MTTRYRILSAGAIERSNAMPFFRSRPASQQQAPCPTPGLSQDLTSKTALSRS